LSQDPKPPCALMLPAFPHLCLCVRVCVRVCVYECIPYTRTPYTRTCMHACMHAYIHTHAYIQGACLRAPLSCAPLSSASLLSETTLAPGRGAGTGALPGLLTRLISSSTRCSSLFRSSCTYSTRACVYIGLLTRHGVRGRCPSTDTERNNEGAANARKRAGARQTQAPQ